MARGEYTSEQRAEFAAQRREQLEAWQSKLAGQVTDLVNGDAWQHWLDVASRFHQYSFRNTMMIYMQRPDATLVAGYQAWRRSFGRQVNRGETGIKIFAPVTRRTDKTTPDGKPVLESDGKPAKVTQLVGVKLVSVFDVSQTSGPELPVPMPTLLTGQAPPGLWDSLQRFVEAKGFRVGRGDCEGANGFTDWAAKQVQVRADIDDAAAVKTLAHEACHVLLHAPTEGGVPQPCRGLAEVEAESVAYLITKAHGLDSGQYTFSYVAGWAQDAQRLTPDKSLADVITDTGERVVKAADTVLAATQPAGPGLVEVLATNVERGIHVDRTNQVVTHSAERQPHARHELSVPAPERSIMAAAR